MTTPRQRLILILGDQLDEDASALRDFDPAHDTVWMAEVLEESTHIPSSKQRTTVFLSAMRHFAAHLQTRGWPLIYSQLDDAHNTGTLAGELSKAIAQVQPHQLVMTAPGDWRVLQSLRAVAKQQGVPLEIRDDTHFFSTVRDFAAHAKDRKQLRLEYFYRELRQKNGILMEGKKPIGGQWNFDADNRGSFGKQGPGMLPPPTRVAPDAITQDVMRLVNDKLADAILSGGKDGFKTLKICVGYDLDGTRIDYLPTAADQQARCKPIYEEMEGWSENTAGARSWAELPGAAVKYVRRIEELIQCPVALLSTSPERDDTILVTDPFAD